jgi:hypothetical protein
MEKCVGPFKLTGSAQAKMNIYDRLATKSDTEVLGIWEALGNYIQYDLLTNTSTSWLDRYDDENTMDDWAQAVYSELERRGLK